VPRKGIGVLVRRSGVERERKDFADFYQRSRNDCLRAVLAGTGDRALAEDLVAEGFARAWASWQKVSRHPAPAAWVVRTALNVRVSWWRRRRREVALEGGNEDHKIERRAGPWGPARRFACSAWRRIRDSNS
jgi:DNA-directed RNA polymerase specialized sigma24 family protein